MPQRFPPPNEIPPPPVASCSYVLGYSKSPLARLAAMPSKPTPKYHSRRPEVVKLLTESAISPDEASPLSSDYPSWVIAVAALSLYNHPSYPAHLAFWRPDAMNSTAEFVDTFLSSSSFFSHLVFIDPDFHPIGSREAKYLDTLEGWIDAEFSLYTLKGFQRGFYPHLYDPVTGGRILRKRKAKEIGPDSLQVAQDTKPKRRTKRARKAKGSNSPEPTTEPNSSPSLDSTPPPPADIDLETNILPTTHVSLLKSPSSSPDLSSAPTPVAIHRERSPSMTSSGASGGTLVDSEGVDTEPSRANSPADTAVDPEEVADSKVSEQRAKDPTGELDVEIPSIRSSLPLVEVESTPPPPPRRSTRVKKPATQIVKRPSAARSKAKRVPA
jgi:hypothetical protein